MNKNEAREWNMKRIIRTISIILAILLAAAGGYYGGRRSVRPMVGITFYAVIEEIRENRILVQGLEINDINGRGTFELAVGDKTELIWRGVPITLKDLRAGNKMCIRDRCRAVWRSLIRTDITRHR